MARKRKLDSKTAEPSEPPQKQQQTEEQPQVEEEQEALEQKIDEQETVAEVEEAIEDVVEVEVEGEEEDEDTNEEGGNEDQNGDIQPQTASLACNSEANEEDEEDEEPIENFLEPFGKEYLIKLLSETAEKHSDVADRIRSVANEDPAHRKIFVHGLGWDTNTETLIETFKCYGEIEDCKAVCDKVSGKSKGFGFILFKTRSGARKALKEPQKKIGNRMTACQLATVGPASSSTPQTVAPVTQRKIFVSNVAGDLDPQKLYSFFSKFGEIEEGPLGLDRMTGKPKGFCLFVYKTVESARRVLEEPHKNFDGHMLHCQQAVEAPKQGKSQHQHHQNPRNSHFQRNNQGGYGGAASGTGHLMAPAAARMGASPAQALNPALGRALNALFATQGANLGLNPAIGQALLGSLGSAGVVNQGIPPAGAVLQYGNQASINPGVMSGYVNQVPYQNQQMGQGGAGRGQHGTTQYGGVAPYMTQ